MFQSNVVGYLMEYEQNVSDQGNAELEEGYTFADLCVPLRGEMMNYARRLAPDHAIAEDVVQQAYIRALEAWDRWEPVGDVRACVKAWLYRIVTNTYMSHYQRARTRRDAARDYATEILHSTYGCSEELDVREAFDHGIGDEVREALASLTTDHRRVVEMHYLEGISLERIAKMLDIPKKTVGTRLHRARALLAKRLGVYALGQYGLDGAGEDVAEAPKRPAAEPDRIHGIMSSVDASALLVP